MSKTFIGLDSSTVFNSGETILWSGGSWVNADANTFVGNGYVTTGTTQNISGLKTFTSQVNMTNGLYVSGTTTYINTENMNISDNLITLNSGETGSGVTLLYAGIEIDRGDYTNYVFLFDETQDNFRIGESGSPTGGTQAVATRQDNPTDTGLAIWNNSTKRFDTDSNLTYSSGNLTATTYYGDGSNLTGIVTSASNGLTKSSSDIKLGGTLTEHTTINGDNSYVFYATEAWQIQLDAWSNSAHTDGGHLKINENQIDLRYYYDSDSDYVGISMTSEGLRISDGVATKGAFYPTDYSANFFDRSLVDKEYVDNAISGGAAGNHTEIQINSGGSFTGDSDFLWDFDNQALTVGDRTGSIGTNSMTVGTNNEASANYGIALGNGAVASGTGTMAVSLGGKGGSTATGDGSLAMGFNININDDYSAGFCGSNTVNGGGGANFIINNDNLIVNGAQVFMGGNGNESYNSITCGILGYQNIITANTYSVYYSSILAGQNNNMTPLSGHLRNSAILGGSGHTLNHSRSVILGGGDITSDAEDTVYGINFKISNDLTLSSLASGTTRTVHVNSAGTLIEGDELGELYITDSYIISQLESESGWSGSTYAGTLTGITEGQRYLNSSYTYEYVNSTIYRNITVGSEVAGNHQEIQVNSAGTFASESDFRYNFDTNTILIGNDPAGLTGLYPYVRMVLQTDDNSIDGAFSSYVASVYNGTGQTTQGPGYMFFRSRGTADSPEAIENGDAIGRFTFSGHDGSNWKIGYVTGFKIVAAEDWVAGSNYGTEFRFDNIVIGDTTESEYLAFEGAGYSNFSSVVKIGNNKANGDPISPPENGMIRWDGSNFAGYNGSGWVNFDESSASASNGLSVSGSSVILGGSSITDGVLMPLSTGAYFQVGGSSDGILFIGKTKAIIGFQGAATLTTDSTSMVLDANGVAASFAGLKYFADYSNNYVDRSLVDKAYVDSLAGIQAFDTLTYGTTTVWNLTSSTNAEVTLTGNITTLTINDVQDGMYGTLKLIQGGSGGYSITLPANSKVANRKSGSIVLSTEVGDIDILSFVYDGTDFLWNVGYNYG